MMHHGVNFCQSCFHVDVFLGEELAESFCTKNLEWSVSLECLFDYLRYISPAKYNCQIKRGNKYGWWLK